MAYRRHLFTSNEPKGEPISFRLPLNIDTLVRAAAIGQMSTWMCRACQRYLQRSVEVDAVMAELERPWTGHRFKKELRHFLITHGNQRQHGSPLWQIFQEESQL